MKEAADLMFYIKAPWEDYYWVYWALMSTQVITDSTEANMTTFTD